jgi:hypothetical protein
VKNKLTLLAVLILTLFISVFLVSCMSESGGTTAPKGDQLAAYYGALKDGKPVFAYYYTPT